MKRDAGFHIFVALMEGDPHYEYEIMRIPSGLVKSYGGGWVEPR